MTTALLVKPGEIEHELLESWSANGEVDKVRAALFNLLVYVPHLDRSSEVKAITKRVIRNFPSRVLFITHDKESRRSYLETEVAVDLIGEGPHRLSCDMIHIRYAGSEAEKVPFLILPHLLPDLPVYLLWLGGPREDDQLFEFLSPYLSRAIFDPYALDMLPLFSRYLLGLVNRFPRGVTDLQWAATEGWRQVIAGALNSQERLEQLAILKEGRFLYARDDRPERDPRIQASYLQAWIASQMKWRFTGLKALPDGALHLNYEGQGGPILIRLEPDPLRRGDPGAVVYFDAITYGRQRFEFSVDPTSQLACFRLWTPERCDLPHTLYLPHPTRDELLAREIFQQGTTKHYQQSLKLVSGIQRSRSQ